MGFISSPLRATQRDLWVCLPGTYLDSNQRHQLSQASSVTYTPNSPDKSRPSIGRFHNLGPFADDARQDCRWCDHVSVSQQSEINARPLGQSSVLGRIDKVEASCWSRLLSEHIARAFVRLGNSASWSGVRSCSSVLGALSSKCEPVADGECFCYASAGCRLAGMRSK